jgi:GxxExxY protein
MPYEGEDPPFVDIDPELNRLSGEIIGAAIEVHRCFGPGLEEELYEAALCAELRRRNMPFARQVWYDVIYKGEIIGRKRMDLIVAEKIVVELKSVDKLAAIHRAQLTTYLRISGLKLGLLINFNAVMLKEGIKRVVLSEA